MNKIEEVLHLYLGCEVEYEGIVNGKQLAEERRRNEGDFFAESEIKPIKGVKMGFLKHIQFNIDGSKVFMIGRKGLQVHRNTAKFKPLLRPLESMTEEEKKEYVSFCRSGYEKRSLTSSLEILKMNAVGTKYLLSKHFDLFGLIESGHAIDSTK